MDVPVPDARIVREIAQKVADIALHDAVHVDQWIGAVINSELGDECKLTRVKYHTAVARRMAIVKPSWPAEHAAGDGEAEREAELWLRLLCVGDSVDATTEKHLRTTLERLRRLEQALTEPDPLTKATLIQGIKPWTGINDMPTADLTPEEGASFDAAMASLREDPQADEVERLRGEVARLEQERAEDVAAARRERNEVQRKLDDANAALWLFASRYGNQTFYERDIVRTGELKAAVHAAAEERAAQAARNDGEAEA